MAVMQKSSKTNSPSLLVYLPTQSLFDLKAGTPFSLDKICVYLTKILKLKYPAFECLVLDGNTQEIIISNAFLADYIPNLNSKKVKNLYPQLANKVDAFLTEVMQKLFHNMRNGLTTSNPDIRYHEPYISDVSKLTDTDQQYWTARKELHQIQSACDHLNIITKGYLLDGEFFMPHWSTKHEIGLMDHQCRHICSFKLWVNPGVLLNQSAIVKITQCLAELIHRGNHEGDGYFQQKLQQGNNFTEFSSRSVDINVLAVRYNSQLAAYAEKVKSVSDQNQQILSTDLKDLVSNRFAYGFNSSLMIKASRHQRGLGFRNEQPVQAHT